MRRILVVICESEHKAYEGIEVLRELDIHGDITVYAHAVVTKNPDGRVIARERDDQGPYGLLVGTALGALIGALGGATGLVIGATAGLLTGNAADWYETWVGEDFIDDVSDTLSPNKTALVAEIEEQGTDLVDSRMKAIGGTVFRRDLSEAKHAIHEEHIAALKADLVRRKAQHAQAHAKRKVKLQETIIELESRLQAQLQKAKERSRAAERETRVKAALLQNKAAGARAEAAAKAKARELPVHP